MSSTEKKKKSKKVALPTSLLLYKEKKKVNSGLTYLALDPTLPSSTYKARGKKKPVVPDKRNFPSNYFV